MMTVNDRNSLVKQWVKDKLDTVKLLSDESFSFVDSAVASELRALIEVNAKGFRGVVITSMVARYIDSSFSPFVDFYACNPRTIFEQAIWYVLTDYNIPCGKSDPLNVAKNTNILDEMWAKGKRPESAALAAVAFMRRYFNDETQEGRELLENYFFYKLLSYANTLANFTIKDVDASNVARQWLANSLIAFSLGAPEAGATPQLLVSLLLEQVFSSSRVKICGGEESVFGTNTTSKKPADIWMESPDGDVEIMFEVTLKKIDIKRLDDFIGSIESVDLRDVPMSFVCRLPEDIASLSDVDNGVLSYKGFSFEFVDYASFIRSHFSLLSHEAASQVYDRMQVFVESVNTSVGIRISVCETS